MLPHHHFSLRTALVNCTILVTCLGRIISFQSSNNALHLGSRTFGPSIYVASNEFNGTVRAAQDLAIDIGRVTTQNGTLVQADRVELSNTSTSPTIIVGTIGSSKLVDDVVASGKINGSSIKGKWESYIQATVDNPVEGVSKALVIAGSDMRGSIYGIYDISETIGVLPYYFWADIPFKQKDAVFSLPTTRVQESPSVKYRGIFINDEESGLMVWADTQFPKSSYGCPFTHTFYQHVFELILRLKGNFLWPGMKKECGFYADDPLNGAEATRYGIFVGTSHHEPMATSYSEQKRRVDPFDWLKNLANVQSFFEMGVERAKNFSTMWTLGMRGDGDQGNDAYTADTIEEIIEWQQNLLHSEIGKELSEIPQSWEVGKYWEAGMNVSDEATLVWTDDNFGNLNRVPVGNEVERSGGAGVYFHFQYVGAPRSWRWGNTVQNVRTWEQMHLAYERGAREIWLANVGDIKPLEIPTSHFMAMAYDMTKFTNPDSTGEWLAEFAGANYYNGLSNRIADLLTEFGILAGRRKWELYNGDGSPFAFNTLNYQESQTNLKRLDNLVSDAKKLYQELDSSTQVAYYETVLYPILSGYHVVQLYTYYDMAKQYKKQGRTSTNNIAAKAHAAFEADSALTKQFQSMLNGRWNEMVDEPHIGMRDFGQAQGNAGKMPPVAYISDADTANMSIMGVIFEGRDTSLPGSAGTNQLLAVNPYLQDEQARWLDIFARKNGTFKYTISTNASFVSTSYYRESITSPSSTTDIRSIISVDWDKAPPGMSNVALTVTGAGVDVNLVLPVNNVVAPTSESSAFIEADGVVSMEAAHYSSVDTNSYIEIPAYGRTLSAVKRWPATAPSTSAPSGPKLTYTFYTFTSAENANLTLHLGQTGNVDPVRPLKYAYSIDGEEVKTVQPIASYAMGDHPTDWIIVVKDAVRRSSNAVDLTRVGEHILDLWLLEPEIALTKIVLDLGGERVSYLGPPESRRGEQGV